MTASPRSSPSTMLQVLTSPVVTYAKRRPRRICLVTVVCCGLLCLLPREKHMWRPLRLVDLSPSVMEDKPEGEDIVILDWTGYSLVENTTFREDNCVVTRDRSFINRSLAVVITNRQQKTLADFPKVRRVWQRWVWLLDESPYHAFDSHDYDFDAIKSAFNWTMTYRKTSDVYIPYGWTTRRDKPEPISNSIGNRQKLVAVASSNCFGFYVHNLRFEYISELQKHIQVDKYGRCWNNPCTGHTGKLALHTCANITNYLFYLAFENADCREYISEKTFSHGFDMGTVPVVMGASKEDYLAIAPPNSFIHVNDFANPADLAKYLTFLSTHRSEYMKYHEWRKQYSVSYRLQYVKPDAVWRPLCRALRQDSGETKIYEDLEEFWTTRDCSPDQSSPAELNFGLLLFKIFLIAIVVVVVRWHRYLTDTCRKFVPLK